MEVLLFGFLFSNSEKNKKMKKELENQKKEIEMLKGKINNE